MKPVEQLIKEHDSIKIMLAVLAEVSKRMQKGQKVPVEDLENILKFLRLFADKCHHGKEEDFLFPALEEVGIQKEGGPIEVMLQEHIEGRNYIQKLN